MIKQIRNFLFQIIIFFLMYSNTASRANDFDKALEAANRGDYYTARRLWQPLAEQGDALAEYNIGYMHYNGHGGNKDYGEAVKWYTLSALHGNNIARYALGVIYESGEIIDKDYKYAEAWYKLAADAGYGKAQFNLAMLYLEKKIIGNNSEAAIKYLNLAAENGLSKAQYNLGKLYQEGILLPKNDQLAYIWLSLASLDKNLKSSDIDRDNVKKNLSSEQVLNAEIVTFDCVQKNFKFCNINNYSYRSIQEIEKCKNDNKNMSENDLTDTHSPYKSTQERYSVQFGAPPTELEARALISHLKKLDSIGNLNYFIKKAENNGRIIFRVRSQGFSRENAINWCQIAQNIGVQCFVAKELETISHENISSQSKQIKINEKILNLRAKFEVNSIKDTTEYFPVIGNAYWYIDNVRTNSEACDYVLKTNIVLPINTLLTGLSITLKRNRDLSFPASHIIEMIFVTPKGSQSGPVRDIELPQLRIDESLRGSALFGLPIPVSDNVFLIGLTNLPDRVETNLDLLRNRKWFMLPLRFSNGQKANLFFENGINSNSSLLDNFIH